MSISISVCVSTCGSDEWRDLALSWALPSVENQSHDELVVVHLESGGVAEARNQAAEQATGDLLIWVDADDQLCDGYVDAIRTAAEAVTENDLTLYRLEVLRCLFVPALGLCDQDGVCLTTPTVPDWDRWPELNCCCIGTAVPRDLYLSVGGQDPSLPVFEDYSAVLAMVAAGARLVPVPDAVYCATRNPNGRNLQPLAVRQETYEKIRARYDMASIPRNAPLHG